MKENKGSASMGKKILIALLAVVVAVGAIGTIIGVKIAIEEKIYADSINKVKTEKIKLSKKEKEFSIDGFSITLTEDFGDNGAFEEIEFQDDEIGCAAEHIELYVRGEGFEAGSEESKMTAEEFTSYLAEGFDGNVKVSEYNGVPLVEYKYKGENDDVVKDYKVFCYKGEDCFWMVHFMIESNYTTFYKPYIYEWVETIVAE